MSTATTPTLSCAYCANDVDPLNVTDETWQQWKCPTCASWNDRPAIRDTSACIPPELVNKFANAIREIVDKPACHTAPALLPVEILDAWLFYREEYQTLLGKQLPDAMLEDDVEAHIRACDEALEELQIHEKRVNELFNRLPK